MKHLKSGLSVAALVCLIYIFMPYGVQAQDDGTDPWPCPDVAVSNGLTQPWPCEAGSQSGRPIPSLYYALAQEGGSNPLPYYAPVQDDVFVPQLYNTRAGFTSSMADEILYQYALYEDRRQDSDLICS